MNKKLPIIGAIILLGISMKAQNHALVFDGVDDKVVVNNNAGFNSTTSLTVEAWIYANSWKAQQWQGTIVGHDGTNNSGYALRCGANGKLSFVVGDGGWSEVASGPVMQAQTWNHVAGVINNGKIYIYINGAVADSASLANTPIAGTGNLLIGESPGYSGRVFDGAIDEVRIWNVARTAAEISANKAVNLPVNEPGLIGYYQFNQISGTTTPNSIATSNTLGTLVNFGSNPWVAGYVEPSIDLSATALISPDAISLFSKTASRVRIRIENKGVDTIQSFTVGYKLNNRPLVTENLTHTIYPTATFDYSFKSIISEADSISRLKVFVVATNDANTLNDTLETEYVKPANTNLHMVKVFDNVKHNFGAAGQSHSAMVTLPDNNSSFEQIVMHISVNCPSGGCDPWDQPAKISLLKDGNTYELARFITPYGKACGPWTVDVTSFKNLLQGACLIESYIQVWGQSGWLLNVDLEFVKGKAAHPFQEVTPLWDSDNWIYGDPNISYDLPAKTVSIDPHTRQTEMRMTITGHGQGNTDNAAEFSPKTHTIKANGNAVTTQYLWKTDCAQNSCSNQAGTWLYSRAGWCPGQAVDPFIVNLTQQATAGSNLVVDYVLENYTNLLNTGYNSNGHTEPHYKIHAYLVQKADQYIGNSNYKNAVASLITYPITATDLNANTQIKVEIKNQGAIAITNADLYYYVNDSLYAMENANLGLNPGDSMEYTFSQSADMSAVQHYNLSVMVDADDDAASDDVTSRAFGNPVSLAETPLSSFEVYPNPSQGKVWIKGSNMGNEVQLQLMDVSGKQVYIKTVKASMFQSPYRLEQKLAPGIYLLKLSYQGQSRVEKLVVK